MYIWGMDILFEDFHLLVVNKPGGLTTESGKSSHPSAEKEMLAYVTRNLADQTGTGLIRKVPYLRAAHRLDRPASGVLVFGKTRAALSGVMKQFEEGTVEKSYLAQTSVSPNISEEVLNHYIRRDETGKRALVTNNPVDGSQPCGLTYRVLREGVGMCLLEVRTHTGRFHQIRAQLSHIGCPISGDILYGGDRWRETQIKLLACNLVISHPFTGERLKFSLTTPTDW